LVGEWDTSANLYQTITGAVAVRYDTSPTIDHESKPGAATMRDMLQDWFPLAPQHERYVWGMLASLVYVEWDPETGRPFYLLATQDRVEAEGSKHNPRRPVVIRWARKRPVPAQGNAEPEGQWFWDEWDISNPQRPTFRVLDMEHRKDVTAIMAPDLVAWRGPGYPHYDESGAPVLPFAWYYTVPPNEGLWPVMSYRDEIVFGTLQVGLLWTAMVHGLLRASWDQRYVLNGKVTGGAKKTVNGYHVQTVTPDPTSVVQIEGLGEGNVAVGAWGASLDIEKAEGVTRRYESRLQVHFGLSSADTTIEALNPASGASIAVSQRAKRALQARSTSGFLRGDNALYRVVAAVCRPHGVLVPQDGYSTTYAPIALTPEERVTVNSYAVLESDHGVMSRTGHYMALHPGTDPDSAAQALATIDLDHEREAIQAQARAQAMGLPDPGAEPPGPETDPEPDPEAA
jgi:hypothetical protein